MNNKITFNTLKKWARQGILFYNLRAEHGIYGMEFYRDNKEWVKTTLVHLAEFKVSRNWIRVEDEFITLSNCCYSVKFRVNDDEISYKLKYDIPFSGKTPVKKEDLMEGRRLSNETKMGTGWDSYMMKGVK